MGRGWILDDEVGISDPMGWNMPDQVERQLVAIKQRWPSIKSFNLHLHNTRGMVLHVFLCLPESVGRYRDLSAYTARRSGGCPFCWQRSVRGLAPTEDLIHMLEGMGIETGVDLYKLIECCLDGGRDGGSPAVGTRFQKRA